MKGISSMTTILSLDDHFVPTGLMRVSPGHIISDELIVRLDVFESDFGCFFYEF